MPASIRRSRPKPGVQRNPDVDPDVDIDNDNDNDPEGHVAVPTAPKLELVPELAPDPEPAADLEAEDEVEAEAEVESPAEGTSPAAVGRNRVIAVVSAKGGVGKTTIATNLAVGLAQDSPLGVVLIDADMQFGDVATALSLAPSRTLPDLVSGVVPNDTMVLKTYLTPHPSGFYVVCGRRHRTRATASPETSWPT